MDAEVRLPGSRGVFCLGMLQILVWGGSFFLLAVMGEPIIRDTGWGSQWVYGALSLSLMISALLAPLSSRLVARFGGRLQLACSGLLVALGLLIAAACHTLPVFLLAWAVIGIGMAAGLYEALFSTLGALYAERAARAITGITLISGFATTLTWPLVASAIEHVGWRGTCVGYAVLLLLSTPLYLIVLPSGGKLRRIRGTSEQNNPPVDKRLYLLLIWIFALGAIIMTAISVQLVTVLQGLGYSLTAAIALSSLLGPSQVASRVLQMIAGKRHPIWTALVSAMLVALGVVLVAFAPGATAVGLVLYGLGNGLRAIVRGMLPLVLMPASQYVALMGKMSRPSLIGQALTPLAGGYLMQQFGATGVLVTLCSLAVINVVLVGLILRFLQRSRATDKSEVEESHDGR